MTDWSVRSPECAACQDPVGLDERRIDCADCGAVHHASCWRLLCQSCQSPAGRRQGGIGLATGVAVAVAVVLVVALILAGFAVVYDRGSRSPSPGGGARSPASARLPTTARRSPAATLAVAWQPAAQSSIAPVAAPFPITGEPRPGYESDLFDGNLQVRDLGSDAVGTGPALEAPVARMACIGETWRARVAPGVEARVSLEAVPRGMSVDGDTGEITWAPRATQIGEQQATIDLITPAGERTRVELEIEVGYRQLELPRAERLDALPSRRALWWVSAKGELELLDPVTRGRRAVDLGARLIDLAEMGDRLYAATDPGDRILEIDLESLTLLRELRLEGVHVDALAPHPGDDRLSVVFRDSSDALKLALLPLTGGEAEVRLILDSQGTPIRCSPSRQDLMQPAATGLVWLTPDRFALRPEGLYGLPFDQPRAQALFVLSETSADQEDDTTINGLHTVDAAGRHYTSGGVYDSDGDAIRTGKGLRFEPGGDGFYSFAFKEGRRIKVTIHDLPDGHSDGHQSFELPAPTYSNPFQAAWVFESAHLIAAMTTTTFTEGVQVYLLPF